MAFSVTTKEGKVAGVALSQALEKVRALFLLRWVLKQFMSL